MVKNKILKMSQKMLWKEMRKNEEDEARSTELMKKVTGKAPSRKKIV